jgi:hypothetical protein
MTSSPLVFISKLCFFPASSPLCQVGRKASAFLGRGYKALFSIFLLSERPMGGQPKSKASSWSSAEVGRLSEEPPKPSRENQSRGRRNPRRLRRGGCQSVASVWGGPPSEAVPPPTSGHFAKGLSQSNSLNSFLLPQPTLRGFSSTRRLRRALGSAAVSFDPERSSRMAATLLPPLVSQVVDSRLPTVDLPPLHRSPIARHCSLFA